MRKALVVLMLSTFAFAEPPTAKECRSDLAKWDSMFKAAYAEPDCIGKGTPSCAFVGPVRDLHMVDFSHIAFRADACGKRDRHRRFQFQQVAAKAENFMVMRAGSFITQTNQDAQFNEWEQSKMQSQPVPQQDDQPAFLGHLLNYEQ
jgi:hypothetical protein